MVTYRAWREQFCHRREDSILVDEAHAPLSSPVKVLIQARYNALHSSRLIEH